MKHLYSIWGQKPIVRTRYEYMTSNKDAYMLMILAVSYLYALAASISELLYGKLVPVL